MIKTILIISIVSVAFVVAQDCVVPPQKDPLACCSDEIHSPAHKAKLGALTVECTEKVRSEEGPNACHGGFDESACVFFCIGSKLGLVDSDGYVIASAMRDHLQTKFTNTEWVKNAAEEVTNSCIVESTLPADRPGKCNPTGALFTNCAFRTFAQKCPPQSVQAC